MVSLFNNSNSIIKTFFIFSPWFNSYSILHLQGLSILPNDQKLNESILDHHLIFILDRKCFSLLIPT